MRVSGFFGPIDRRIRATRLTLRRYFVLPASLLLALPLLGGSCRDDATIAWQVSWSDEFEAGAGEPIDPAKWRFDIGGDGWGNAQLEYNTDRAENVSHDGNGNLAIVARRENYLGNEYTSARINTAGLFEQEAGRFEARIRLPVGQGIWPAFWMLGSNFASVGWPACGEIDIMEYRGQEPRVVHGSIHGPRYSGGEAITGRYVLPGDDGFNNDFHVFAVEWDQNYITWSIDGNEYQSFTRDNLPSGAQWVFDHPFFIILNVAVGGHFVGPPNTSTTFPQTMLIDWVRVYRLGP